MSYMKYLNTTHVNSLCPYLWLHVCFNTVPNKISIKCNTLIFSDSNEYFVFHVHCYELIERQPNSNYSLLSEYRHITFYRDFMWNGLKSTSCI